LLGLIKILYSLESLFLSPLMTHVQLHFQQSLHNVLTWEVMSSLTELWSITFPTLAACPLQNWIQDSYSVLQSSKTGHSFLPE